AVHQGGDGDRGRSAADDTGPGRLDDPELLAEVHRLVDRFVDASRRHGSTLPAIGTRSWWEAPDFVRLASLLVLGEAWLAHDPERAVRERFKALTCDLSAGHDWTAASRRPSWATLAARRAEGGAA
ncbi:MAG: hypothetical protein M3Q39_13115, partial [Actinomycetota bacterium]|nr:hypothetical protein [Actinomycetota bacterium]